MKGSISVINSFCDFAPDGTFNDEARYTKSVHVRGGFMHGSLQDLLNRLFLLLQET
jgi:hypothetical protein